MQSYYTRNKLRKRFLSLYFFNSIVEPATILGLTKIIDDIYTLLPSALLYFIMV